VFFTDLAMIGNARAAADQMRKLAIGLSAGSAGLLGSANPAAFGLPGL
jgi:hypothetical protein